MGSTFTVTLPDIGEGVVEGEVIEWLKSVGDSVEKDEPIVVVMTDKATVELPTPHPGTLSKQYYQAGEIAIKDLPLYDVALEEGYTAPGLKEHLEKHSTKEEEQVKPAPTKSKQVEPTRQIASSVDSGKGLATPKVRGVAKQMGIDLSLVKGSGPGGRIELEDLRQGVTKPNASASESGQNRAAPPIGNSTPVWDLEGDVRQPFIGVRKYISEKMVEAKYIIPNFAYFDSLDASRLMQLRSNIKPQAAKEGIRLTFMPFMIRALSMCLTKHPSFNSSLDIYTQELVVHQQHNIGIAIKTDRGVIVPVLKNVQTMSMEQVIKSFEVLKNKALDQKLSSSDMKEATFTLSNFGTVGGKWATPIINYPEVGILAVARIAEQAVVKNSQVCVKPMLNCSWCFDHRVIDGDQAASFSNYFFQLMENPSRIL